MNTKKPVFSKKEYRLHIGITKKLDYLYVKNKKLALSFPSEKYNYHY